LKEGKGVRAFRRYKGKDSGYLGILFNFKGFSN
jgi:hypothetical protein